MHKLVKELALTTALAGIGIVGLNQRPLTAQAAVRTHKLKSMPKRFRGTWYVKSSGKTFKIKVTAKRFGISKYRHTRNKKSYVYNSEQYFTPYKVTGAKSNTLYLVNGIGSHTVRQTTIKHHKALVDYDQQEHSYSVTTWTKSKKKNAAQKVWGDANPFGNSYSKKALRRSQRSYKKINPYIKKYFGSAVKKRTSHGFDKMHHIKISYYMPTKTLWKLK